MPAGDALEEPAIRVERLVGHLVSVLRAVSVQALRLRLDWDRMDQEVNHTLTELYVNCLISYLKSV